MKIKQVLSGEVLKKIENENKAAIIKDLIPSIEDMKRLIKKFDCSETK